MEAAGKPRNSRRSNLHFGSSASEHDVPVRIVGTRGNKKGTEKRNARPGKIKFYGPRKRNVIARAPRRKRIASSVMVIPACAEGWVTPERDGDGLRLSRAHPLITN